LPRSSPAPLADNQHRRRSVRARARTGRRNEIATKRDGVAVSTARHHVRLRSRRLAESRLTLRTGHSVALRASADGRTGSRQNRRSARHRQRFSYRNGRVTTTTVTQARATQSAFRARLAAGGRLDFLAIVEPPTVDTVTLTAACRRSVLPSCEPALPVARARLFDPAWADSRGEGACHLGGVIGPIRSA
jgi:hypothetical protein